MLHGGRKLNDQRRMKERRRHKPYARCLTGRSLMAEAKAEAPIQEPSRPPSRSCTPRLPSLLHRSSCPGRLQQFIEVMDPLSIVAGAIAVATLAAQTANAFAVLSAMCNALPGRMHALKNEVADIELVLNQVAKVFKERAASPIAETDQVNIPQLLKQARNKLTQLKSLVEHLTKVINKANMKFTPFVGAYAFKKEQARLVSLQEDIRIVKCSLNIMLGASNSYAIVSYSLFFIHPPLPQFMRRVVPLLWRHETIPVRGVS